MSYTLFMTWNWWEETLTFSKREYLLTFLRGGFVPEGCALTVEHEGKRYAWDRESPYAKPWRTGQLTSALRVLQARQESERAQVAPWLGKAAHADQPV